MSKKKDEENVVIVGEVPEKLAFESWFVVGKLSNLKDETYEIISRQLKSIGKAMERYGLSTIKEIDETHVRLFFDELHASGFSKALIAQYATAMRKLCNRMDKSAIVPSNKELGCAITIKRSRRTMS